MSFLCKKGLRYSVVTSIRTLFVLIFSIFFFDACNTQVSLNKNLNPVSNSTKTSTPTVYPGTLQEFAIPTSQGLDEPANATVFDGGVYFTSLTPNGAKIYRYKNSVLSQISNTNPGGDDNPSNLTVVGPYLCFSASNGSAYNAYKYDGTTITQISHMNASWSGSIQDFLYFNNQIYFTLTDIQGFQKVYVNNGLTSVIAFHTSTVEQSDSAWGFKILGTKLYFSSYSENSLQKLYQYDGTSLSIVHDFNPGNHDSISELTVGDGKLYFVATNSFAHSKLYSIDGTSITQLPDTFNASSSDQPQALAFFNGKLYFRALDQNGDDRLHVHENGTTTKILAAGSLTSFSQFKFIADRVFFTAYNGSGYHLYEYDGSNVTQPMVIDQFSEENPSNLTVVGNNLYFTLTVNNNHTRLFKYNLTTTSEITNIMGGNASDNPNGIGSSIGFGDHFYFTSKNLIKSKFYITDGISTSQISNTNNLYEVSPQNLIAFNGKIYFSAVTPEGFRKLYRTEGTTITQISNLNPGSDDDPNSFFIFNNKLFFSAMSSPGRYKVFALDEAGVIQISDTSSGGSDDPTNFFQYDSQLCFSALNSSLLSKIFCYDGFVVAPLLEINVGKHDSPSNFLVIGTKLYFSADSDGFLHYKVYQFDGTVLTLLGDSIGSNSQSDEPSFLVNYKNNLYFVAYDPSSLRKIFKFDGSVLSKVGDINLGSTDEPYNLIASETHLYFSAINGANQRKLFAYDETSFIQISNTSGDSFSDNPQYLTMIDNKLYVNLDVSSSDQGWHKLYVYNGISPLQISNTNTEGWGEYFSDEPYYVTKLGDHLFYSAFWQTKKQKLYLYANGKESLATIISPGMGEMVANLVAMDGSIYFTANFGGEYFPIQKIYKYTP